MKKVGVIDAPLARALSSSASTRALARAIARASARVAFHAEVGSDRDKIVPGQHLRARHQLDMRVPEPLRTVGPLDQLGRWSGERVAGERLVAEHITQTIAEFVPHLADPLVGRAAVGASIAAVFDQSDRRVDEPENM